MKTRRVKRATPAELACIRDIERVSAFDLVDQGKAKILTPDEYPEPIKRFMARRRTILNIRLSPALKRKLQARSRRTGVPEDELARKWIEEGVKRDVG
jgi:hypothetical protein